MARAKYITDWEQVATVKAKTVPLDIRDEEHTPFRFNGIVDQFGTQLGAVSDRHALVQNVTVVKATADALFDMGHSPNDLRRGKAMYANGKSSIDILLPGEAFRAPGDPSDLIPSMKIKNHYAGLGSLEFWLGLMRVVCTNGMTVIIRGESIKLRHVGEIGYDRVYEMVRPIIAKVMQQVEDQKEVVQLLAGIPAPMGFVDQLLEEVGDRYRSRLLGSIQSNITQLGDTGWAVAQGITEHATHDRPIGWATQDWEANATKELISLARTF
jgi:hypothetical protein